MNRRRLLIEYALTSGGAIASATHAATPQRGEDPEDVPLGPRCLALRPALEFVILALRREGLPCPRHRLARARVEGEVP